MDWRTHRRHALLVALFVALFAGLWAAPAAAQSDDGSEDGAGELAIFGMLDYEDPDTGDELPVAGVTVTVEGVSSAETDANGEFRIIVPGPGDYAVEIDVAKLPEGVNLRNPDANPLTASVTENRDRRVLFPLVFGEASDGGAGGTAET